MTALGLASAHGGGHARCAGHNRGSSGEEDRVTSFRELFEQAASLAVRFVEHGIQRQDRIALVLPKTTEAIVSVFASLLAGAIYVPIHPQWPKERIETTLADCGARLVIEGDNDSSPRITDRQTGGSIPWPRRTDHSSATFPGWTRCPEQMPATRLSFCLPRDPRVSRREWSFPIARSAHS